MLGTVKVLNFVEHIILSSEHDIQLNATIEQVKYNIYIKHLSQCILQKIVFHYLLITVCIIL